MYSDFEDPQALAALCNKETLGPNEWLMICLARSEETKLDQIITQLSAANIRFFGGVFPALIDGDRIRETGAVVKPLALAADPAIVQIDGDDIALSAPTLAIAGAATRPTCLVLADFACVAVTSLLEDLFDKHGSNVNYFGAGAGNGTRVPSPVLFSNAGRFTGAAIVAFVTTGSEVRLRHGWSRNSEHVIATRTQGNVLQELNWEPAMKVYREIVGDQVADSLTRQEDVPEAKRYPFGIAREDLEDVVRDPIAATDADELVVLSGIPEHSVMHVLKADNDKLIESAGRLGADFPADAKGDTCLVFDCFSRARLLADDFSREISAFVSALHANKPDCHVEGALALGEISSNGNRFPDFHNKTIAAGLFHGE